MTQSLRFIDDKTGNEINFDNVVPEQVFPGNILTHTDDSGKHHYQVREANNFPAEPAHLVPAKSNLFNVGLLLGSLAITWFLLDWAFSYFGS